MFSSLEKGLEETGGVWWGGSNLAAHWPSSVKLWNMCLPVKMKLWLSRQKKLGNCWRRTVNYLHYSSVVPNLFFWWINFFVIIVKAGKNLWWAFKKASAGTRLGNAVIDAQGLKMNEVFYMMLLKFCTMPLLSFLLTAF